MPACEMRQNGRTDVGAIVARFQGRIISAASDTVNFRNPETTLCGQSQINNDFPPLKASLLEYIRRVTSGAHHSSDGFGNKNVRS